MEALGTGYFIAEIDRPRCVRTLTLPISQSSILPACCLLKVIQADESRPKHIQAEPSKSHQLSAAKSATDVLHGFNSYFPSTD